MFKNLSIIIAKMNLLLCWRARHGISWKEIFSSSTGGFSSRWNIEILFLRCGESQFVSKEIKDYFCQLEDLRNGTSNEVHISRLKFCQDASLDTDTFLSDVLTSETGMPAQHLHFLIAPNKGLQSELFRKVSWSPRHHGTSLLQL